MIYNKKGEIINEKSFIIFIAFIFITILPVQTISVSDNIAHKLSVLSLNEISDIEKCILTKNVGLSEIKTVDDLTLKTINKLDESNEEKVQEIFDSVGIAYVEESKMQKEIIESLDTITNISVSTRYMKVDENGTQTVMSKEDCFSELQALETTDTVVGLSANNSIQTRSSVSAGAAESAIDDYGYMQSDIAYIYAGSGEYLIVGQWQWLKTPLTRLEDGFSVCSPNMTFAGKSTNSYEKITSYRLKTYANDVLQIDRTEKNTSQKDPKIHDENIAVYYTWDLPNDANSLSNSVDCSEFMCQLWATATVTDFDDYTQMLSITSRYIHKKLTTSAEFGFSVTGGLILDVTLGIAKKDYDHSFVWNYLTDVEALNEN